MSTYRSGCKNSQYPTIYTRLSSFSSWLEGIAGVQPPPVTSATSTATGTDSGQSTTVTAITSSSSGSSILTSTNAPLPAICPSADVYQPCDCTIVGETQVALICDNKNLNDAAISLILRNYIVAAGFDSPLALLSLSNNQLTKIPYEIVFLSNLNGLWMIQNQITTLTDGTFDSAAKLKYFSLAENQITSIESAAFPSIRYN